MAVNPFNYRAIGGQQLIGGSQLIGADDESVAEMLGIMGDDDDDDDDDEDSVGAIVGALHRAAKRGSPKARLAMKKIKARMGVNNVQTQGEFGRYLLAGGSATQGAATGSLDVSSTLQEEFRPQRLIIQYLDASNVAVSLAGLVISDILCGTRSQLSSLGSIPASMFSADATNQTAGLMFDTVGPGCAFVVRFASVTALFRVVVGISGTALR